MTIIRLNHMNDPRLKAYVGLTNHQLRNTLDPKRGLVIVESQIAIRTALARGVEPISMLLDERRLQAMDDVVGELPEEVPVFVLPSSEAEKLTGYSVTRGALCAMRRPLPPSADELLDKASKLVVLEGITDTSNVGAIFRNAAALGSDGVLVAPSCADPLSRRCVRVSMGNVFAVPWVRIQSGWPDRILKELEKRDYLRVALALDKRAVDIRDVRDMRSRTALFFGSEGYGLHDSTLRGCDLSAIIPMEHGVDSLNVAASSAIAMWELFGARNEL